jgi:hypothetical protein
MLDARGQVADDDRHAGVFGLCEVRHPGHAVRKGSHLERLPDRLRHRRQHRIVVQLGDGDPAIREQPRDRRTGEARRPAPGFCSEIAASPIHSARVGPTRAASAFHAFWSGSRSRTVTSFLRNSMRASVSSAVSCGSCASSWISSGYTRTSSTRLRSGSGSNVRRPAFIHAKRVSRRTGRSRTGCRADSRSKPAPPGGRFFRREFFAFGKADYAVILEYAFGK